MLKYLRKNGCPWNEGTCSHAAWEGHLHVIKYAHENGCPWDEETCSHAAWTGQLHVLQWARENGCPWDEETCRSKAIRGGEVFKEDRTHVIEWIDAQGFSA